MQATVCRSMSTAVTPDPVSPHTTTRRYAGTPARPLVFVAPSSLVVLISLGLMLLLGGCATEPPPASLQLIEPASVAQQIAAEAPGDYFIGRRIYCSPFAVWGYVRSPGQHWRSAKLVILNEKYQFAPDRAHHQIGADSGSEYRLHGYFSGDQIYDASAGRFCPEFVLKSAELISSNPDPIWSPYFVRDRRIFEGWPRGGSQPISQ